MAPVYKIAIIQMQPKDVALEENFTKASSYIRKAAAEGAHVAILPEYHLTSWCPDHPEFVSSTIASASYVARYQALAKEVNINIIPGTICDAINPPTDPSTTDPNTTDPPAPLQLRNMTYWISAGTGTIAGSYQKKNLWHPERPHLTAGKHAPHAAFDTPLTKADGSPVRAGLLVCWDLAFPEAFRALIADGADVIAVPSWWHLTDVDDAARALNPDCERVFLNAAAASRAFENVCCVVFCNAGGLSQVAMPILGAVGAGPLGVESEEIRVVEVDLAVLELAERNYKVREDLKGEGWHYGYTLSKGGEE